MPTDGIIDLTTGELSSVELTDVEVWRRKLCLAESVSDSDVLLEKSVWEETLRQEEEREFERDQVLTSALDLLEQFSGPTLDAVISNVTDESLQLALRNLVGAVNAIRLYLNP